MNRTQISMEFLFRASPTMLYKFLTAPTCLIRWFCDKVDNNGDEYTFIWGNSEEVAFLVDDIEDERIRYKWENTDDPDEYLEFKMSKSSITNETILEINDYCDSDDVHTQKQLWHSQIEELRRAVGG